MMILSDVVRQSYINIRYFWSSSVWETRFPGDSSSKSARYSSLEDRNLLHSTLNKHCIRKCLGTFSMSLLPRLMRKNLLRCHRQKRVPNRHTVTVKPGEMMRSEGGKLNYLRENGVSNIFLW